MMTQPSLRNLRRYICFDYELCPWLSFQSYCEVKSLSVYMRTPIHVHVERTYTKIQAGFDLGFHFPMASRASGVLTQLAQLAIYWTGPTFFNLQNTCKNAQHNILFIFLHIRLVDHRCINTSCHVLRFLKHKK